jgi:phage-related protein
MAQKGIVWLHGEVKTPLFSIDARRQAGFLLRLLQEGHLLSMPDSRPLPSVSPRCHELRIRDSAKGVIWRVVYRIDADAIIIGEIFAKKTQKTPAQVIDNCRKRFNRYDAAIK